MDEVLQSATEVAHATIPGVSAVSMTTENGEFQTVAASDDFATRVDKCQYEVGAGPCFDAFRQRQTVVVTDQRTDTRWPHYAPRAVEEGVRSSLAVPLQAAGWIIGAFNVYSTEVNLFDDDAQRIAENLAAYAAVVVNNASLYFTAASRADQMAQAMQHRAVIEQAKGILMGSRRCDANEAFGLLVELSQKSHRKLRNVAQTVVDELTKPR